MIELNDTLAQIYCVKELRGKKGGINDIRYKCKTTSQGIAFKFQELAHTKVYDLYQHVYHSTGFLTDNAVDVRIQLFSLGSNTAMLQGDWNKYFSETKSIAQTLREKYSSIIRYNC